ncbi:hypothetical protein ASG11_16760 [Sphingomonas sp. Leaf357]|uniref:MAPEG family protein n=1 Tax=Sphingomonas sp. Leaf357 TaxID=1736350 RepID=UPI0006F2B147|nr:MAPEG family protein [Sphingomonas sp. Leaf357]KQS01337.1 hypothetical protein ASG11_16760 [Sphingomonas sp. Leaf357]
MNTIAILWPTFALVALVFAVWFTLFVQRTRHMKRNPPSGSDFASGEAALRYFRPVEMPANNLANLFEMPVLYFALVPLLMITHHAGHVQVLLAWAFVVCRAVHSFIQIGPKKVRPRFFAYLLSCVALSAMWIGFFVDMLAAASALSGT